MATSFSKQLGGVEDLLLDASGAATVTQARASGDKTITKINGATIPVAGKFGEAGFKSINDALDEKQNVGPTVLQETVYGGIGLVVGNGGATWDAGTPITTEATLFQKLTSSGLYRWVAKLSINSDNILFRGRVSGLNAVSNQDYMTKVQSEAAFLAINGKADDTTLFDGEVKGYFAKVNGDSSKLFKMATPVDPSDGATKSYADNILASANLNSVLIVKDIKTVGTAGGTFTSGAWRTRDLNTVEVNNITGASLASNQMTLPQGSYEIYAVSPAFAVNKHRTRLYNATTASTELLGNSAHADATTFIFSASIIIGRFVLAATSTLELQHRCDTSKTTTGFGISSGFGDELYSQIIVRKFA